LFIFLWFEIVNELPKEGAIIFKFGITGLMISIFLSGTNVENIANYSSFLTFIVFVKGKIVYKREKFALNSMRC
tara:strand:- start:487 stop:708 length:222 start_codon:yes stop_codon:yes gene_type:complete